MADETADGAPVTPLVLLVRPVTGRILLIVHGDVGEWKRRLESGMLWISVFDTGVLAEERVNARLNRMDSGDLGISDMRAQESGREDKEIRFEVEPSVRTDEDRVVLARVDGVGEMWWRVLERSAALTVAVDVAVVPVESGATELFIGVIAYDSGFVQDRLQRIPLEPLPEQLEAKILAEAQKIA